ESVDAWDSVRLALFGLIGKSETEIGVMHPDSDIVVLKRLDLSHWQWSPDKQDPVQTLGIVPLGPKIEPVLAEVKTDSAAQKAGLLAGDRIVRIGGKSVDNWRVLAIEIRDHPSMPLALSIEREGAPLSLTLIPDTKYHDGKSEGFAGIIPKVIPLPEKYQFVRQYDPVSALSEAASKTWRLTQLTVDMIVKLITGDVKLNALSGPISIAQGAGVSAEYGVVSFMLFLALISVNLGVINLFPLPVLDGGHLLFLLIEKIKGTPVSEQVQEYSYRIGVMVLLLLMGLALFNDFSRL
ncbi:MAG: RIP metalloprotease RseP, partial [Enterobacteriaceae bacterium]